MSYSPKELGLTLSYECNLRCSHCIVEAGPEKKGTIKPDIATKVLDEARSNGIRRVLLYGGEPFLQRDLMFEITEQALSRGFDVTVDSNGFWGESQTSAKDNLHDLQELAAKYQRHIAVSLSVDQYHQPHIPVDSIANIITEYRFGEFPSVRFQLGSLKEEKSNEVLAELAIVLRRRDIYLALSKFQPFIYAALLDELKPFGAKQRKRLIANLGLEDDVSDQSIEKTLSSNLLDRYDIDTGTTIPLVYDSIKIGIFSFGRMQSYIIVPDNYLIGFHRGNLIKAGRSDEGIPVELPESPKEFKALFIDPSSKAYACPALMRSQEGIPVDNKPLSQVIFEVGNTFIKKNS